MRRHLLRIPCRISIQMCALKMEYALLLDAQKQLSCRRSCVALIGSNQMSDGIALNATS